MTRKLPTVLGAAVAGVVLASAGQAHALFFVNGTGLASPTETITFDEHVLAVDTPVTNQYSDLGVVFSPALDYTPQTSFANIVGNDVGNYNSSDTILVDPTASIFFTSPQTAAAFAMAADVTPYTFTALLSGVPVDSGNATVGYADLSHSFYGFSGVSFDQIQITRTDVGGGSAWLVDNVQLGNAPVPEPASLALLTLGAVGLLARRRRA